MKKLRCFDVIRACEISKEANKAVEEATTKREIIKIHMKRRFNFIKSLFEIVED